MLILVMESMNLLKSQVTFQFILYMFYSFNYITDFLTS
jgi:hypothetical protein